METLNFLKKIGYGKAKFGYLLKKKDKISMMGKKRRGRETA